MPGAVVLAWQQETGMNESSHIQMHNGHVSAYGRNAGNVKHPNMAGTGKYTDTMS